MLPRLHWIRDMWLVCAGCRVGVALPGSCLFSVEGILYVSEADGILCKPVRLLTRKLYEISGAEEKLHHQWDHVNEVGKQPIINMALLYCNNLIKNIFHVFIRASWKDYTSHSPIFKISFIRGELRVSWSAQDDKLPVGWPYRWQPDGKHVPYHLFSPRRPSSHEDKACVRFFSTVTSAVQAPA